MTNNTSNVQELMLDDEQQDLEEQNSNLEKIMKILVVVLVICLLVTAGLGAYSLLYYEKANPVMEETAATYNYVEEDDWYLFSNNNNNNVAIFFYPRAKLDEMAYFYLANMLQRRGYDVFIAKSLFHQPSFSLSLVDKAMEKYPKYASWFLGSHGSGTDAVDRYLQSSRGDKIEGAFYLGSLPSDKVMVLDIPIFIAIGSNDTVFDWDKYETNKNTYFTTKTEIQIIDGGNQTNFGYYDLEYKDSESTITSKEQQDIVANRLDKFIDKNVRYVV